MQKQAKMTSRGRITVPVEIRRILRVKVGDRLLFESDSNGIHIRPIRLSALAKYCGSGNPGIPSGRKGINRWLREMRGHED